MGHERGSWVGGSPPGHRFSSSEQGQEALQRPYLLCEKGKYRTLRKGYP
jgi:hypothetical protein